MSIEPEVPYDLDDEIADSWRDPDVLQDDVVGRIQIQDLVQSGIESLSPNTYQSYNNYTDNIDAPDRVPDDYWVLPANRSLRDLLGNDRKARFARLREETAAYLEYNDTKGQIDIWGDSIAIQKAKDQLNMLATNLHENEMNSRRKRKGWARPERPLTEKERRRAERHEKRLLEERSFQQHPTTPQPFTGVFMIPDRNMPIMKYLGDKEVYLNSLRAECKCYMWYDKDANAIRISADSPEKILEAGSRLRNWYLKSVRRIIPQRLHLLRQPKEKLLVRFSRLPLDFIISDAVDPIQASKLHSKYRLMEPMKTGVPVTLQEKNLIDLDDDEMYLVENTEAMSLSPELQTLDEDNAQQLQDVLEKALESIRLFDWEFKMKIRFGQICLIDYPNRTDPLSLEELAKKYFPNPKFRSGLAPCIAVDKNNINPLLEYLNRTCKEYHDSPRVNFSIDTLQYPTFTPSARDRRDSPPLKRTRWPTTITCTFNSNGSIALWNCLTDHDNIVTANCVSLDSDYSWELRLQSARRLPSDIDTPQGQLATNSKLGTDNSLVYPVIRDIEVQRVSKKTKWLYGWDDWVVEVGRDEIWLRGQLAQQENGVQCDLSLLEPNKTVWKVAIYKESWHHRLAQNLTLKIGEAPYWKTTDFLASEGEDARVILTIARSFIDILNNEVPLYWKDDRNSVTGTQTLV
ncbi:hypothetical protein BGW37DRAFT_483561 [Umbelopsis sp. PMI_123]|nr:hypothetical protein BGW37DRAFT_483561 [Umbelopsis sp. PMI_123]